MDTQQQEEKDKGFYILLAEKRQKELLTTFKSIQSAIDLSEKRDAVIVACMDRHTKAIEGLIQIMQSVLKTEKQEIKIETNQKQVVDALEKTSQNILDGIKQLKQSIETPKSLDIKRNKFSGLIESANEIKNK
jgi:hypothetical protein